MHDMLSAIILNARQLAVGAVGLAIGARDEELDCRSLMIVPSSHVDIAGDWLVRSSDEFSQFPILFAGEHQLRGKICHQRGPHSILESRSVCAEREEEWVLRAI